MMNVAPHLFRTCPHPSADPYVLLVDDHEPSVRRLGELVSQSGHRCLVANSGAEALHLCDARRPQVIVTDLSMPNLDGLGLARWLQGRHPSVPIILMTGQSLDAHALEALRRRFTAVLAKPIDVDQLLGLLDRVMPRTVKRDLTRGRP
jgi:CheY-like chemotaxis protein